MNRTVLQTQGNDANTSVAFHYQVEGEVLNEVIAVVLETLAIKCVQQRVTCAVSNAAAPAARDIVTLSATNYILVITKGKAQWSHSKR